MALNKIHFSFPFLIHSPQLILLLVNTALGSVCRQYERVEPYNNCGGCGICYRVVYRTHANDDYACKYDIDSLTLQQYFEPESGSKCVMRNLCYSEEAKKGCGKLKCVPMFASFRCECGSERAGRLCQHPVPPEHAGGYAVVDNVLFSPVFDFSTYMTISILFSALGKALNVKLSTLMEINFYDVKKVERVQFNEKYCKTLYPHGQNMCTYFNFKQVKWVINIRVYFPGREFGENRPYLYKGNTTFDDETGTFTGKIEVLKLFVYSNQDPNPVYENSLTAADLLVSPHFSSCEPRLTIRQGSDSAHTTILYAKREEFVIANFFKFTFVYKGGIRKVCFENLNDFKIRWIIWKHSVNYDEISTEPVESKLNVPYLKFSPYSLEVSDYKVRNNVTVLAHGKEGFSTAYSYFSVVTLDLEPVIEGGSMKKVYYKTALLTLNATSSRNPNLSHLEKNKDLLFNWKCDKCSKENEIISQSTLVSGIISYQGPFKINELYTFTLTIESRMYKMKQSTSQKILMAEKNIPSFDIICKKNCGFTGFKSNLAERIYLKVKITRNNSDLGSSMEKLTWTYSSDEGKDYASVEKIRQVHTPSDVLIVEPGTLSPGKKYIFRVEGDEGGQATFDVQVAAIPTDAFSCSFSTTDNEVSVGSFDYYIKCDGLVSDKLSPRYEFYDRHPDGKDTGRLITTGNSFWAKYVGITRGLLVVEVTDRWGMLIHTFQLQKVVQYDEATSDIVDNLYNFIDLFDTTVDPEYKVNAFSMIADILLFKKNDFGEEKYFKISNLLERASEQDFYSYSAMKLWTISLNIIATVGLDFVLISDDVFCLSKTVMKLVEKFLYYVKTSYDAFNAFTTKEILQISQALIDLCNAIYQTRWHDLEMGLVSKELEYEIFYKYKVSVLTMISSIKVLLEVFSMTTLPHQAPLRLGSRNITLWIKEDIPDLFIHSNMRAANDSIPSVRINTELAEFLKGLSDVITVKVVLFTGNPFWWDTDLKIITNALNIEIKPKKDSKEVLESLKVPISIHLDFLRPGETIIKGSVQQPDPAQPLDLADQQVVVYRLRVDDRSAMRLLFKDLQEGESMRVRHLRNLRPDYRFMLESDNVTKAHPEYSTVLREPTSRFVYDLDFLGILPGAEVPVGQWQNFSFSISIMHCASWEPMHGWNSKACEANKIDPETKQLVCECRHLSTFAGFATVPKEALNAFQNFRLILDIFDNPLVAAVIISLLAAYFIVLIFAYISINRDRGCVIYLEDNIPSDQFPYLIVVYTGSRLMTGTTSNVGIELQGEDHVSRPHILRSSRYKTLQRGDDNWFIMYTRYPLGKLTLVKLWMNYSGRSPEWYINKLIVIDIYNNVQYKFLVNDWLSLKFGNSIERFERVHGEAEIAHKDLIDENLALGFRESHLWFSAFSTHARSALTKPERTALLFCGLFVVMLVGCIFYGLLDTQEERSEFSLTWKQVIVGAISQFAVAIFTGAILSTFRRSLTIQHLSEPTTYERILEKEPEKAVMHKRKITDLRKKNGRSNNILKLFSIIQKYFVKRKRFIPVHCGIDIVKSKDMVKKYTDLQFTYIAFGMCVILVIVCAFFIIYFAITFQRVKCLQWISSILWALVQDVFLVSPLKIILLTIISVVMNYKIYDVVRYDIDWKVVRMYKNNLLNVDPYAGVKAVTARCSKMYVPLPYKEVVAKQYREDMFDAVWLMLDLVVIALFAIILILQSNTMWTTKFYWSNYQLKTLFIEGYKGEGYQSSDENVTTYLRTLRKKMFPVMYQTQWYNGRPMSDRDDLSTVLHTFDGVACILGLPRIRQLRLKPGLCHDPVYHGLPMSCPATVNQNTEDTDIYREGWKTSGSYETFKRRSVWDYRAPWDTQDKRVYGYTNMELDAGGYVADLGSTRAQTEDFVHYLKTENWLDRRTGAVVFEFTVYNPNARTLSWLVVVTESPHISVLINKLYVYTVDQDYDVFLLDVVVFVMMCAFVVRLVLVLNRRGIQQLFFNFWNRFEIMIVVINIYCAILYVKNILDTKAYTKRYLNSVSSQYFEFAHLINMLSNLEVVYVVMYLMVMCRFVKNWNLGRDFDRLLYTIWSPWSCIIWVFVFIFILIFIYWKMISYLLNEFIYSRIFFILLNRLDFKHTVSTCPNPSCKVSVFVSCMLFNCFLCLVVLHYIWSYKIIKATRGESDKSEYNIFTIFYKDKAKRQYLVHRQ